MIPQLTPTELHQQLVEPDGRPVIQDVREPWGREVCALADSTHIPMGQVLQRLTELQRDAEIVVLCHHGVRSQQVAYFLKHQGFEPVFNLRGGIDAWSHEVEPAMSKY